MLVGFKDHLREALPFLFDNKLLIACSGGLDSMVLAHLAKSCDLDVSLAHCNYKLRGADSDNDEALVRSWARKNGCPVFLKTLDLGGKEGSVQLAARELRYKWFRELMEAHGLAYVLTAHHANDRVETFFINLLRGTGLEGLTGIPEQNGNIIRPLLPFSKEALLAYAHKVKLEWREDGSNKELKYLRNKIRNKVVPVLKEIAPLFLQSFQKTQAHLGASSALLKDYALLMRARLFEPKGGAMYIAVSELKKLHPLSGYLFMLFHDFGFTQWIDIEALLFAQSGKEIRSSSHRLIRDRDQLILSPLDETQEDISYLITEGQNMIAGEFSLFLEEVPVAGENGPSVFFVDREKLNYPLKLRKWKMGDYFYPLGMKGKKKLSKFFKDEKLNTLEKEAQWLLCSGDTIVWLLGRRGDDRFKVTGKTKSIVKITWKI